MLETRNAQVDYDALLVSGKGIESIAFWKYAAGPRGPDGSRMMDARETRALSKASGPVGSYLVPQDFYDQVVAARRAVGVLGRDDVSLVLTTEKGTVFPVPAASAHGVGSWIAESGAYPTSSQDDTFTQAGTAGTSMGAHKAGTRVVVSEDLAQDAGVSFDSYMAGELGGRISMREEAAFAVGDGSGKPLGIANASSGITTVTAATGSTTSFKLADIKAVYKALPAAYRPYASWLLHPDDFAELAALADTAGGLIYPTLHAEQ